MKKLFKLCMGLIAITCLFTACGPKTDDSQNIDSSVTVSNEEDTGNSSEDANTTVEIQELQMQKDWPYGKEILTDDSLGNSEYVFFTSRGEAFETSGSTWMYPSYGFYVFHNPKDIPVLSVLNIENEEGITIRTEQSIVNPGEYRGNELLIDHEKNFTPKYFSDLMDSEFDEVSEFKASDFKVEVTNASYSVDGASYSFDGSFTNISDKNYDNITLSVVKMDSDGNVEGTYSERMQSTIDNSDINAGQSLPFSLSVREVTEGGSYLILWNSNGL